MVRNICLTWGTVLLLTTTSISPLKANELLEYGEYLSKECSTCHKKNSKTKGIPSIVGIEPESFIKVLKSYKDGTLKNETMISVAKSLDDEQMNALALYFHSLKKTEKTCQKQ